MNETEVCHYLKQFRSFFLGVAGGARDRNGVGILVDGDLRERVVEFKRISDGWMAIKLVIGRLIMNVVSAYAPHMGLDEEVKKLFWEGLDEVVRGIPGTEFFFIGKDFNGHIGASSSGFDDVYGGFGFGERDGGGASLLDFVKALESWLECVDEDEKGRLKVIYKTTKTEAKLEVMSAKTSTFERLYMELGDKGGDKRLYRLAKARERKAHNLDQVMFIKDDEGKVLVDKTFIKQKWQAYFYKLLNKGDRDIVLGDLALSHSLWDFGYCRCIRVEEVRHPISRMYRGRATSPDETPMNFWKSIGKEGREWLSKLFNVILKTDKMLDE
ncbi:uncharacterized protein LOC129899763 [Solanum dulcamara]|uniref:uncharacterized protein LOC129899763 n=1 Tax=Solanum dulcamara TaxID=45834 RepID=UPI0024855E19|nr:uncharacterized protein LOC129899763 [Solanum dulcamara]